MPITDARDAVFIPAICLRARVGMRQILPGIAVGAVVFTHGSPRAFADIWTPALPMRFTFAAFFQALFLSRQFPACFHHSPLTISAPAIESVHQVRERV